MRLAITTFLVFAYSGLFAQLFINGDVTIEQGAKLYVQDTVWVEPLANIQVSGILETTRDIKTNMGFINTLFGYVVMPIQPNTNKIIGIGNATNNIVGIKHNGSGAVLFKLAVNNNVFANPENSTTLLTANVVNKTWHIEPLSNAGNTNVTIGWNGVNETSGFNRTESFVAYWKHATNSAWTRNVWDTGATNTGNIPEFTLLSDTFNLTTGVHYFGVGSTGSALPVTFLNVSAKSINEHTNMIQWQVASLINSSRFEVEKSSNGETFVTIGKINTPAKINVVGNYIFNDDNATENIIYYRIKQVDLKGTYTYSTITSVNKIVDVITPVLYPNPSVGSFAISGNTVGNIKVFNQLGALVMEVINYNSNQPIATTSLPAGFYQVQYKTAQTNAILKLIVQ